MPGAGAELAAGLDLAALRDVAAQARNILVIDFTDVVDAEAADFAPSAEAAATAAAARATTAGSAAALATLSWGARPETSTWRFALRASLGGAVCFLLWFVIAHLVLVLIAQ